MDSRAHTQMNSGGQDTGFIDGPREEGGGSWLLEVTDLKQYRYCPRIVFYRYCLPRVRPITYKMSEGIRAHEEEATREERRTLHLYGLPEGERIPHVRLTSSKLGLNGQLDLVITLPNRAAVREAIPVEYKWATRAPGSHFRLQIAAYALLLEECWGVHVRRGFIYQPPTRVVTEVLISPALRRQVIEVVGKIRTAIAREIMPPPPRTTSPCANCEFRRFCNDVV